MLTLLGRLGLLVYQMNHRTSVESDSVAAALANQASGPISSFVERDEEEEADEGSADEEKEGDDEQLSSDMDDY